MAVTRLRFYGTGNGTYFIDLAQALSLHHRRLHRQKQIYTVYGGHMFDALADGNQGHSSFKLNTAPMTWTAKAAVNRGFRIWKRMIAETLKNSDSATTGKYNDFKVRLNHGTSNYLLPKDANDNDLPSAEWNYSTLTAEDPSSPDTYDLQIVGPHAGSAGSFTQVSLLQSWLDTRPEMSATTQPDMPADYNVDPLINLLNEGDIGTDRLNVIDEEGDRPPYDEDEVFGTAADASDLENNLQRVSFGATSLANPTGMFPGFQALCGLVQLNVAGQSTAWEIIIDVESKGEAF